LSLLQEAARVSCLADFEDLPIDLQVAALRNLMSVARDRHQETLRQFRVQRTWFEVNLDDVPSGVRVIE